MYEAILVFLGGLVGVVGNKAADWLRLWFDRDAVRSRERAAADRTAVQQLNRIVDRHERHIDEQQARIEQLSAVATQALTGQEALWGLVMRLKDRCDRSDFRLKSAGQEPETPVRLPEWRSQLDASRSAIEYANRSAAHATGLVKEADSKATPPKGGT